MLQRFLAITLLPCLLLPPAESLGHLHSGVEPVGHSRPHFHLATIAHDHEPETGGHHHECEAEEDSGLQNHALWPDHDDDAVFLSVNLVAPGCDPSLEAPSSALKHPIRFWLSEVISIADESSYAQNPHPPPTPYADCPRYLLHLALLI
jgi:hypothetical protein